MATVGVKRSDVGEIPYCFVVTKESTDVTVSELRQVLSGRYIDLTRLNISYITITCFFNN